VTDIRRLTAAGGVALAAVLAVGGGLAANIATSERRWPGPLEWIRGHPWPALAILTAAVVLLELWLWWPRAQDGPAPVVGAVRLPPRNRNFTGREPLLRQVRAALTGSRVAAVVAVHGLGGIGKTQLAVEYAHRFANAYDLIWWIDAEQPTLVPEQLGRLAAALRLPGLTGTNDDAYLARAELRRRRRWLVVFDNGARPEDIARHLPDGPGHVLITSRAAGWGALGATVDVDTLSRAESVALLRRRVHDLPAGVAAGIAERLGDLPLALEQAASFIEETASTGVEYLRLLDTASDRMLSRGRPATYQHTVATVWQLSAQQVRTEHPAAAQLFDICAFLAPEAIPLDLFTANRTVLPEPLRSAAGDDLAFVETVGALTRFALCRRLHNSLLLHRLVQSAARHALDPAVRARTGGTAIRLLRAALPAHLPGVPLHPSLWRRLMPHVLIAVEHVEDSDELTSLLIEAATEIRIQGDSDEAIPLAERALAVDLARYGPDHLRTAERRLNLGVVLWDADRNEAARTELEAALTVRESALDPHDPLVAQVLNMLALTLSRLDETEPAIAMMRRAQRIDLAAYGADDWRTAHNTNNLALILERAGRLDEARRLFEEALALDEARYGPDHPNAAIRRGNLARVLLSQGDPGQAVLHLERAAAIDAGAFGEHSMPALGRTVTLAAACRDAGDPDRARTLARRALAAYTATLGADHRAVHRVQRLLESLT
jgi:tetratricopeptide (TPR) repeat protein